MFELEYKLICPFLLSSLYIVTEIHTWQVFLAICSIPPPLIAGISVAFLPESPKFLMSRGKNEKAMQIFKQLYSINTGNDPNSYPVSILQTL